MIGIDIDRLTKIDRKVTKLLKRECRDAVEAMYALKATLHLLRRELIEGGIVLDNEAELDDELTGLIDEVINEGK